MIGVLVDRAKKLQDVVNRLNRLNKLICDSNYQLGEKVGCLDEDNCEKESCVVNEFQKKNKRLKDEYERMNGAGMPMIAIECKKLEGFDERSRDKKYKCNINECGKKFKNNHLESHMISHSNQRPFKCDKDQCGKNFTSSSNFKSHQLTIHTNRSNYKYVCDFEGCAMRFYYSSLLSKH